MARYLVTGGAGFIGSHLVDALLRKGHAVQVLDNLSSGKKENLDDRAELVTGDVGDEGLVRSLAAGQDCIFHLAAIASVVECTERWGGAHRVNQTGSINVFDAACRAGRIPVVYASSAAVYGDNPARRISEAEVPRPLNPYGADKLGSELHARAGWIIHRLPTVGLRFFNVFGPRQDPASPYSGVISRFLDRALQGAPLTVFGDGAQTRDFIYVDDVVDHLVAAMAMATKSPGAHVMNVCTGRSVTVAELAQLVGEVVGSGISIEYGPPRAGDIVHSRGDPSAASQSLGLAAKTPLREGLRQTLAALAKDQG